MKKILLTTAVAASVVLAPGVASAKPGSATDWNPEAPYCGPGAVYVGADGDRNGCARTVLPPDPADDGGAWAMLGTAFTLGFLFL